MDDHDRSLHQEISDTSKADRHRAFGRRLTLPIARSTNQPLLCLEADGITSTRRHKVGLHLGKGALRVNALLLNADATI
jgi:hypothetical protein